MIEKGGRVALLYHPRVAPAFALAQELASLVEATGYEPWVESAWALDDAVARARDCTLLVTLGGDGTILRVARAAFADGWRNRQPVSSPPILTIDFGKLGFLAELPPIRAVDGLRQVLAGDFWLEERALLEATLERGDGSVEQRLAVNDVVLARGNGPHAIRLTLFIDDAETARYAADGLIVASPTGSTAYALGAGGPILGPDMQDMVAVPVTPHLAVARAFVVPPSSRISMIASAYRETVVTIDGQVHLPYEAEDRLHVTPGSARARFVRIGPRNYFYATLQARLRRDI